MVAAILTLVGISLTTVVVRKATKVFTRLDEDAFQEGQRALGLNSTHGELVTRH